MFFLVLKNNYYVDPPTRKQNSFVFGSVKTKIMKHACFKLISLKINMIEKKILQLLTLNISNDSLAFKRSYTLYLNIENMLLFTDACISIVIIVGNYYKKV